MPGRGSYLGPPLAAAVASAVLAFLLVSVADPRSQLTVLVLTLIVTAALIAKAAGRDLRLAFAVVAWFLAMFTAESNLHPTAVDPGTSFTPYKLIPLLLLAASATTLLTFKPRVPRARPPVFTWAMAYVSWLFVCAAVGDDPVFGMTRFALAALPVIAAYGIYRMGLNGIWILIAVALAAIAHTLYALVQPRYVGTPEGLRLTGLMIPNAYGVVSGVTFAVGVGMFFGSRRWSARLVGVLLCVTAADAIRLSVARTAALACLFVLVIMVSGVAEHRSLGKRSGGRRLLLLLLISSGVYYGALHFSSLETQFSGGNSTDIGTLSSRTTIWSTLVPQALNHPFFGFGPGFAKVGGLLSQAFPGFDLGQSHNSLVEALVSAGVLGAVLWLGMMRHLIRQVRAHRGRYRPYVVAVTALIIPYTITLGNFAGFGMGWLLMMALLSVSEAPTEAEPAAVSPSFTPAMSGTLPRRRQPLSDAK